MVVVATGCEETLARGFLAAVGLGDLDVVGSTGRLWPPRVRAGDGRVEGDMLIERGYPPPWSAAYSDSPSDLPLFAGTPRPVLVNADDKAAAPGRAHPGPPSRDPHLAVTSGGPGAPSLGR